MPYPQYQFNTSEHHSLLIEDAKRQLDFFAASLRADGGFSVLDYRGTPIDGPQELHTTTRLVHSYALGHCAGFENCSDIIDAGIKALKERHCDQKYGGYYWSIDGKNPVDTIKLAYGHVFVLLAASTAQIAGHPLAESLIEEVSEVLFKRYFDEERGLLCDEFERDWQPFSGYRGFNANMHGVEALLAVYESTNDSRYLTTAGQILHFFCGEIAATNGWRIPEHYDSNWRVDADYEGNPMFRPRGTTPGHSFEIGRLLLQYWDLSGRLHDNGVNQAKSLIETAYSDAVDEKGGFIYTLAMNGSIDKANRYWWPVTEAINALATLLKIENNDQYSQWYSDLWQFSDNYLIDNKLGGWFPELDDNNQPTTQQFIGKPDIYLALQADFIPLTKGLSHLARSVGGIRDPLE